MVDCAFCHELAAVRKATDGRLYYQCMCSRQPIHAHDYVLEHATIWGSEPAPDHAPDWIAKGLRFKPGARETGDRPRAPAPEPGTGTGPPPGPPGAPEPTADLAPPVPAADVDPEPEPEPERLRGGLFW
jgi:hypothetical protein